MESFHQLRSSIIDLAFSHPFCLSALPTLHQPTPFHSMDYLINRAYRTSGHGYLLQIPDALAKEADAHRHLRVDTRKRTKALVVCLSPITHSFPILNFH